MCIGPTVVRRGFPQQNIANAYYFSCSLHVSALPYYLQMFYLSSVTCCSVFTLLCVLYAASKNDVLMHTQYSVQRHVCLKSLLGSSKCDTHKVTLSMRRWKDTNFVSCETEIVIYEVNLYGVIIVVDVLKLEFSSFVTLTEAWNLKAHEIPWY
jgi:hypothetical protein